MYSIPFYEHIKELKIRLYYICYTFILTIIICYLYSYELLYVLTKPLIQIMDDHAIQHTNTFIFTNITEAFATYVQIIFIAALYFTIPLIIIHIWQFFKPGFFVHERRFLLFIFITFTILFVFGQLFTYHIILPMAWKFFINYTTDYGKGLLNLQLQAKISEYILLTIKMIFLTGMIFLFPLILTILIRLNILHIKKVIQKRKFFCLIAFIIAALISPPDIYSQIILAIPILILYELTIIINIMFNIYTTFYKYGVDRT